MIRKTQTSMNKFANATPQISVSLRVSFECFVPQTVYSHSNCTSADNPSMQRIEQFNKFTVSPVEIGLRGSATKKEIT